jgi:hypothetical protein
MSNELPSLGRNPLNALRIITGTERQGIDYVNSAAEFTRGYLGVQGVDSYGNVEWAVASTNGVVNGILNSHKASTFYKSVYLAPIAIDSDGNGSLTPYIKTGSELLTSTGAGAGDITGDFVFNYTNGTITESSPSGARTIYASYQYDVREPGSNETLGSGKTAVIRGVGEIETLVYDTSVVIGQGDSVWSKAGIPSTDGSGVNVVGTVVRPPTADNPYLRIRINI